MNDKGIISVVFAVVMGISLSGVLIAAVLLTPKHRVRKAVEKCNGAQVCLDEVSNMSKDEILEFIKDK